MKKKTTKDIVQIFAKAQGILNGTYIRKKQKRNGKIFRENQEVTFNKVSKTEADLFLKKHGINVKDYIRTMNLEQTLHVLKRHPNMTIADFLIISTIINDRDICGLGRAENTIVYKKTLADEYFYIEFIQHGKKKLALKTFYKKKAISK